MNVRADVKRVPINIEAEQAVLGAILMNNEAYQNVRPILNAEHFYEGVHSKIYMTMGELLDDNRPVTPSTLKPAFETDDSLGAISISEYIARLTASATTVINARGYAQEIVVSAARRQLVTVFEESLEACSESQTRGSMIIDDTAERLQSIRDMFSRGLQTRFSLGAAAVHALDAAEERMASGQEIAGMTTGLKDLDRITGGFHKRELTVVGGRPSMGKTAVAVSLLLHSAMAGHGVLYFSLEMDAERLSERCLTDVAFSSQNRVEYEDIRNGRLDTGKVATLRQAQETLRELPFIIDHRPNLNLVQIMAIARQVRTSLERAGLTLDIVCIDHMDKIKASGYWRGNAVAEAGEKSNGLTVLAKELDVSVVALKQLSRGPENRDDKRPNMGDLRQSGDVEQDADTIIFPFREAYYLERQNCKDAEEEVDRDVKLKGCRNVLELDIAKNRGGKTTTIKAFCDIGCSAVRDMEHYR